MKLVAGGLTGGFGSVLGNPFDLLKTRLMTTNPATTGPRGMWGISRDLYLHQGRIINTLFTYRQWSS